MEDIFNDPTGEYKKDEDQRYAQYSPTGFEKEEIDRQLEKGFRDIEKKYGAEIYYLRQKIVSLKAEFETFKKEIAEQQGEVTELRDISIEALKEEMVQLLADGTTRYADEIALELRVGIQDVITAFSQLKEDGKLFIDEDKL